MELNKDFLNKFNNGVKNDVCQKIDDAITEPSGRYADTYMLRLPSGERQEIKLWCTQQNVSMNSFFYMAYDYVRRNVNAGRIRITRLGIRENE